MHSREHSRGAMPLKCSGDRSGELWCQPSALENILYKAFWPTKTFWCYHHKVLVSLLNSPAHAKFANCLHMSWPFLRCPHSGEHQKIRWSLLKQLCMARQPKLWLFDESKRHPPSLSLKPFYKCAKYKCVPPDNNTFST